MEIQKLLATVGTEKFFSNYYLKQPCAAATGCQHLTGLGTIARLQTLMTQAGATVVLTDEKEATVTGAVAAAAVPRMFAEKWSIGVRHAQHHDQDIATFATALEHQLQGPVDVHLYWTRGGSPGFSWHYDAEDLFILQTLGQKTWEIRKNTADPWPIKESLPKDMRYEREIMPLLRCDLAAGDWLYLPGGYWHRTTAQSDSLSLSVGVMTATGLDIWDFVRARLCTSLRWRQRVRPAEFVFEGADQYEANNHEYLAGLANDIHSIFTNNLLDEFWRDRRARYQRPEHRSPHLPT